MSSRKSFVKIMLWLGAAVIPLVAPAQTAQPEFEVASVRVNTSGVPTGNLSGTDRSRFSAHNITLNLLIRLAWQVQEYQLLGGPAWLNSDRFDITAKSETEVDNDRMMLMLQKLLQDRFKLAVLRETKDFPGYALVAAKSGLKLHAGPCGDGCGRLRIFANGLEGQVSMPLFINVLSDLLARPVTDETKFTEAFDVRLRWRPDESTPGDCSGTLCLRRAIFPTRRSSPRSKNNSALSWNPERVRSKS